MKHPGVFIYRPLLEQSDAAIRQVQAELASVESFAPVEELHMTLLKGEVTKKLRDGELEKVVFPLPKVADESYTLGVKSAGVHQPRIGRVAYTIELQDTDEVFHDEHALFNQRAAHRLGRIPLLRTPHVTVGYAEAVHATAATVEVLRDLIPSEIGFSKLATDPVFVKRRTKKDLVISSIPAETITIQTVRPGTIPPNFLANLRNSMLLEVDED